MCSTEELTLTGICVEVPEEALEAVGIQEGVRSAWVSRKRASVRTGEIADLEFFMWGAILIATAHAEARLLDRDGGRKQIAVHLFPAVGRMPKE